MLARIRIRGGGDKGQERGQSAGCTSRSRLTEVHGMGSVAVWDDIRRFTTHLVQPVRLTAPHRPHTSIRDTWFDPMEHAGGAPDDR